MNKKMVKVLSTVMMIMMLVTVTSNVFAALQPSNITANNSVDTNSIGNMGGNLVAVLQAVGIVLSVVILIVIGLKYMMGSAEEKAEYKKVMIPYLVGALLIFAATTIVNVVYNIFANISL